MTTHISPAPAPIALAHLTLLDVAPPAMVHLAAAAGYQGVGLRLRTVHPAERPWPMLDGSSMLAETRKALDDTGVRVWDVEVIRLDEQFDARDATALLEAGAYLGARFVNIFPTEPDRPRLTAVLAELAELASGYGIKPLVEPMIYNSLPGLDEGVRLIEAVGHSNIGLLIDALHFHRYGGRPSDLRGLAPGAVSMLQLCDASPRCAHSHRAPAGVAARTINRCHSDRPRGTRLSAAPR